MRFGRTLHRATLYTHPEWTVIFLLTKLPNLRRVIHYRTSIPHWRWFQEHVLLFAVAVEEHTPFQHIFFRSYHWPEFNLVNFQPSFQDTPRVPTLSYLLTCIIVLREKCDRRDVIVLKSSDRKNLIHGALSAIADR